MNAFLRKSAPGLFPGALALCLLALGSSAALAVAPPPPVRATVPTLITEAQKIQWLIGQIEALKDARFVRNGKAYDGAAAAAHLRMKLRRAGSRVTSAQDFIAYLATKSSFSGRPYLIRFSDGREIESGPYFRSRLAEFERGATQSPPAKTGVRQAAAPAR